MSTVSARLTVRGVDVDVVYKEIKHLHIAVYPPAGRVRVAAPARLGEEHIRLAVISGCRGLSAAADSCGTRPGSPHYVWGVRRRLRVIERPGPAHVELDHERLLLYVAPETDTAARLKLLRDWQRRQLRAAIPALIEKWAPAVGRTVPRWSIRRMKTRWGSCNRETGHICFNLELSKKHPRCLEYIVVHEMSTCSSAVTASASRSS